MEGSVLGTIAGRLGMQNGPEVGFMSSSGDEQDAHVRQVVKQAHEELMQLLRQRAELMKRIGSLKQTISGLANLFGNTVLSDDLLDLVGEPRDRKRQAGFTNACRKVLMEADRPLSARDVCQKIEEKVPLLLARHREPLASVTTVLNRLASYGEAEAVVANGRRAWQWAAERAS
jgi:chorismate mutase